MGSIEWQVQGDYGYGDGFECVAAEDTKAEAMARLAEYRENEPGVRFRVRWAHDGSGEPIEEMSAI